MQRHSSHRHSQDADHLIEALQELSKQQGERVTTIRREVAMALSRLKEPRTAYQILAELNRKRAPKLSAMSLYRTLDFFTKLGIVIRYESSNTYKLCLNSIHDHGHLLMICDGCGGTQEIDDDVSARTLHKLAQKHGHQLRHHVIELHGYCSKCVR